MNRTATVADTILAQLGGRRFLAMTGAKDFVGTDAGRTLMFSVPAFLTTGRANKVTISLDASDTYTVRTIKINSRSFDVTEVASLSGVHAEDLQRVFTSLTGLDTYL